VQPHLAIGIVDNNLPRLAPMLLRLIFPLLLCLSCTAGATESDKPHTAGPTVRVYVPPLKLPAFGHARRLRVYLPPDYAEGSRHYPVLYMFDGQNLFDEATSYAGEWGVDEAMDTLAREEGFSAIVIGIDHGSELRFNELIPYWNVRFLPNLGEAFLEDVVHTIKPFIDANYRTRPGRAHTAIFGSSLGGLEADYAIHRYPQVFAKAGVFSPSYWVSEDAFTQAQRTALPAETRVYLYMGGREGEESIAHVERMAKLLRAHMDADNVAMHVVGDAEHNEQAWRAEFPGAVRWLFDLPTVKTAGAAGR
jgi:predicted alpha/beta superfamily hydrolase